jgi:ubiquinone/menaquinone biosynthesis C-methylase UbiE
MEMKRPFRCEGTTLYPIYTCADKPEPFHFSPPMAKIAPRCDLRNRFLSRDRANVVSSFLLSLGAKFMVAPSSRSDNPSHTHPSTVVDQFSRQAELFAQSPALHNETALAFLVEAAAPQPHDEVLDIACGPGSVVAAFATRVHRSVGLDATEAMLAQARSLAVARNLQNTEWYQGDVYRLPFGDASFDIVSCRFAFHHFETPERAFAEMVRVCRPGGRIVLCDAVASDDPAKAASFNWMERHRDPSTIAFRPLTFLRQLFADAGLPAPSASTYQVPVERERLIARSFPVNDDRELLRHMIDASVEGDGMGLGSHRDGDTVRFSYPAVVLVASKPSTR